MNRRRRIHITLLAAAMLCMCAHANAQFVSKAAEALTPRHLNIGAGIGTTGVNLEIKGEYTDWLRVRMGVSFMPRFVVPMTFGLESYSDGIATSRIERLQELVKERFGFEIDDHVDMDARARMVDFRLMLDFFPIPDNKHWHLTAGFLWGSSKIGHIQNTTLSMKTTVGVVEYNHLYDYFVNETYIDDEIVSGIYLSPELGDEIRDRFLSYGNVGVHLGNFPDGTPYIMEPDKDCMLKADMFVSHFKPFIGAGYQTKIDQKGRWNFGVDLGALFWGGTPDIVTHPNLNYEGRTVNLTKDVDGITGKVGDYVKIAKAFKVYPSLNLSLSYCIF